MMIFVVSSVLVSCSKNDAYEEAQIATTITADNSGSCVQVFSYDNESVPLDLRKIGYYHNQILDQFTRPPYINDICDRNAYTPIQEKMDQIIQSTASYHSFFGNIQTMEISDFYLDVLNICDTSYSSPDSIIMVLVNETCTTLQTYLTAYEINFIKSFFINSLSGNLNPIIDYVNIVEQNRSKFIDNGNFALAILSIYDNSYCFWSNYNSNRFLPFVSAAMDATGAFAEGARDLYNHGGSPSNDFLKKMGRGALSASVPIVGGWMADWLGW